MSDLATCQTLTLLNRRRLKLPGSHADLAYLKNTIAGHRAKCPACALAEAPRAQGEPAYLIAGRIARWRDRYLASGETWDFIQWGLASRSWQRLTGKAHPIGRTAANEAIHAARIASQ